MHIGSRAMTARLAVLWASICAVALSTWHIDPNVQHVLQFACGGVWAVGVVFMYVNSRHDTGRRSPVWALVLLCLLGIPLITLGVAIVWELLSPIAVLVVTPIRALEAFGAYAMGRAGRRNIGTRPENEEAPASAGAF